MQRLIDNEETCFQYFLQILKRMLQNYEQMLFYQYCMNIDVLIHRLQNCHNFNHTRCFKYLLNHLWIEFLLKKNRKKKIPLSDYHHVILI